MATLLEVLLGAQGNTHPAQGVSHQPHQGQPQAPWMRPQTPPNWMPPSGQAPVTPPWATPKSSDPFERIRMEIQRRQMMQDPRRGGVR